MNAGPVGLHSEPGVVRFQDVDAAGLVFFARIFDYFHDSYVAFLRSRGVTLEEALNSGRWAAPLRHAEAEFLRPLRFGDPYVVTLERADLAETEFFLRYRIDRGHETACTGMTHHVSVDPATFRRAPLPTDLRRALLGH